MSTSQSSGRAVVLETRFVWGSNISVAMEQAMLMERNGEGWKIQGNPSPMFWNGTYGTGVSITRINNG
jgi:hypothetical protein